MPSDPVLNARSHIGAEINLSAKIEHALLDWIPVYNRSHPFGWSILCMSVDWSLVICLSYLFMQPSTSALPASKTNSTDTYLDCSEMCVQRMLWSLLVVSTPKLLVLEEQNSLMEAHLLPQLTERTTGIASFRVFPTVPFLTNTSFCNCYEIGSLGVSLRLHSVRFGMITFL